MDDYPATVDLLLFDQPLTAADLRYFQAFSCIRDGFKKTIWTCSTVIRLTTRDAKQKKIEFYFRKDQIFKVLSFAVYTIKIQL